MERKRGAAAVRWEAVGTSHRTEPDSYKNANSVNASADARFAWPHANRCFAGLLGLGSGLQFLNLHPRPPAQ